MRSRRWLVGVLAGAALLLLAGRAIAALYVDYRWYDMMGAVRLWRTQTGFSLLVRTLSAAAGMLFVFLNLYAVRHSVVSLVLPRRVANLEIGEEVPSRYLLLAVVLLSLLFGALLTLEPEHWMSLALARFGMRFGESDPYFQYDLGLFVYWLPFESALHIWALFAVLLGSALVIFLYALTPSLRWERGTLYVSSYVRRHLSVLAFLLLLLLAWSYRLDSFGVLGDGSGAAGAFTFVDHRVMIPAFLFLSVLTLATAGVVLWAGWTGQLRIVFGGVIGLLLTSLLLQHVAPVLVRRFAGPDDPAARDGPYAATRASYTRRAYGVGRILPGDTLAGFTSLDAASRGVSTWDAAALVVAVERTQRAAVDAVHLGWSAEPDGLVAQLAERGADRASAWWLTRVITGEAGDGGTYRALDEPGPDAVGATVTPVHVAEGAGAYEIVADSSGRLAAVELAGGGSRLAHAWSLQNFRLLVSDLPHPRPRIFLRQDVRERVRALTPYFEQGSVVVPLVDADTLYWMLDLYASSGNYPLSQRITVAGREHSYFQHAAIALVNATTGRVLLVPNAALDPIAATWVRRFPELFTAAEQLPPSIQRRLPPAIDAAIAHAAAFGRYGRRFESGPATTHLPFVDGADSALATSPRTPFALPMRGGGTALAVALPLVDGTERVRGLILGLGGAERRTVWIPASAADVRWPAVVDRLRGDSATAAAPEGAVRGRVRAVPIAGDIAFVQTTYTWRPRGAPAVTRVAVLLRDSLHVGTSVRQAIGGAASPGRADAEPTPSGEPRSQAGALYDSMRAALRRGDWRAFGAAFDSLGRLLGRTPR